MQKARELIKRAIALKPNAHFGREKYQLKAIEWIIAPPPFQAGELPDMLNLEAPMSLTGGDQLKEKGFPDAIKGFSGLIILGNAWESVDVFNTLAHTLGADSKDSLAHLAALRTRELAAEGRRSLLSDAPTGHALEKSILLPQMLGPDAPEQLGEIYQILRREADEWQNRRTSYMMVRLQQGHHPDTHANFWSEWHDDGPPPLRPLKWHEKASSKAIGFGILGVACLLSLGLLRSARQRRIRTT